MSLTSLYRALLLSFLLGSLGCATELPEDSSCLEVATAIGARTEQCTGDAALGEERTERLNDEYQCLLLLNKETEPDYGCALVMRNLACEHVERDGDELDAWLAHTASCDAILERK